MLFPAALPAKGAGVYGFSQVSERFHTQHFRPRRSLQLFAAASSHEMELLSAKHCFACCHGFVSIDVLFGSFPGMRLGSVLAHFCSVEALQTVLNGYNVWLQDEHYATCAKKLGLQWDRMPEVEEAQTDNNKAVTHLVNELFQCMEATGVDFTNTFRSLVNVRTSRLNGGREVRSSDAKVSEAAVLFVPFTVKWPFPGGIGPCSCGSAA